MSNDQNLEFESLSDDDLEAVSGGDIGTTAGTCSTSEGTCYTAVGALCVTSGGSCKTLPTPQEETIPV